MSEQTPVNENENNDAKPALRKAEQKRITTDKIVFYFSYLAYLPPLLSFASNYRGFGGPCGNPNVAWHTNCLLWGLVLVFIAAVCSYKKYSKSAKHLYFIAAISVLTPFIYGILQDFLLYLLDELFGYRKYVQWIPVI